MARLKNANRALKFDKRLTRHNLSVGYLTQEEHNQLINDLPDLTDQCEKIVMEGEQDSAPVAAAPAEPAAAPVSNDPTGGSSSPFGSSF